MRKNWNKLLSIIVIIFMFINIIPVNLMTVSAAELEDYIVNLESGLDLSSKLNGVKVTITDEKGREYTETTNEEQSATFNDIELEGECKVTIKDIIGFNDYNEIIEFDGDNIATVKMKELDTINYEFNVKGEDNNPINNIKVKIAGYYEQEEATDTNGRVVFTLYKGKKYSYEIGKDSKYEEVEVENIDTSKDGSKEIQLAIKKFNINITNNEGGTIDCDNEILSNLEYGTVRNFTINANEGYKIKSVLVDDEDAETTEIEGVNKEESCILEVDTSKAKNKDISIEVIFQNKNIISFNYDNVENYIKDEEFGEIVINKDENTFTVKPSENYDIEICKQNGEVLEPQGERVYTVNNDIDKDIEICFCKKISRITYTPHSSEGSVSMFVNGLKINEKQKAEYGEDVLVVFKPNVGNTLSKIKINDETVTAQDPNMVFNNNGTCNYVIRNVSESSYKITAIFTKIEPFTLNAEEDIVELQYNEENLVEKFSNEEDDSYLFMNDSNMEVKNNITLNSLNKDILISLSPNGKDYNFNQPIMIEEGRKIEGIYIKRQDSLGIEYLDFKENNKKNISIAIDRGAPKFGELSYKNEWIKDKVVITEEQLPIINDKGGADIKEVRYASFEDYNNNLSVNTVEVKDNKYKVELTESGNYYFWVCDKAGNLSLQSVITAKIDNEKPVTVVNSIRDINGNNIIDNSNTDIIKSLWTNNSVTINCTGKDKDSGVEKFYYYEKDDTNNIVEFDGEFTISKANMDKTYYIWAVDAVGNASDKVAVNIKIDIDKPKVEEYKETDEYLDIEKKMISLIISDVNDKASYSDFSTIKISGAEDESNAHTIIEKVNGKFITKGNASITKTLNSSYLVNIPAPDIENEGVYYYWVYDAAGNCIQSEIDKINPIVTKINLGIINNITGELECVNTGFGSYVNKAIHAFINIEDGNKSLGIDDVIITYNTLTEQKTISLKEGTVSINKNKDGGYTATHIFDEAYIKDIKVKVIDKSKNESEVFTPNNVHESNITKFNGLIIRDSIEPSLEVDYSFTSADKVYKVDDNLIWVNDKIGFKVSIAEEDDIKASGLNRINQKVFSYDLLLSASNIEKIESNFEKNYYKEDVNTKKISDNFNHINDLKEMKDGKYVIRFTGYDNANNYIYKDKIICKDSTAPIVSEFIFDSIVKDKANENIEMKEEYAYFSKNDYIQVEVTIDDGKMSSGINEIYYKLLPYGKEEINSSEWIKVDNEQITVNADFKGRIAVKAIDNCKNESSIYYSNYIVVSNKEENKSQIIMKENDSDIYDEDNVIYKEDKEFIYEIINNFAGIKSIEYILKVDGKLSGSQLYDYTEGDVKKELINYKSFSDIINVESADILIEVIVKDNCGNIEKLSKNFAVDKSKPTVDKIVKDPSAEWVNEESVKISAFVSDKSTSSQTGIDSVYYSKNGEESNDKRIDIDEDNGCYSFTTEIKEKGASYKDTYYIWCLDKAYNKSELKEVSVYTDLDNPKIEKVTKSVEGNNDIGDSWTYKKVKVNVLASDGGSGIDKVFYSTNKDDIGKTINNTMENDGTSYYFTIDNTKNINETYYIWAVDKVGNIGKIDEKNEYTEVNVKIDITKPTINSIEEDSDIVYDSSTGTVSEVEWYKGRVEFKLNIADINAEANDFNSQIKKIEYFDEAGKVGEINEAKINELVEKAKEDNTTNIECTFNSMANDDNKYGYNGKYTIKVYDYAGNITTEEVQLKIDDIKPKITAANINNINNRLEFGMFSNKIVEITFDAIDTNKNTDVSSGLDKIVLCTNSGELEGVIKDDGKSLISIPNLVSFDKKIDVNIMLSEVYVLDKAGNSSEGLSPVDIPGALDTNIYNENLIIEEELPEISIDIDNAYDNKESNYDNNVKIYKEKVNDEEKIWANGDVYFKVSVLDEGSGINNFIAKINGKELLNISLKDELNKSYTNVISTKESTANEDGSYLIEVIAEDNCGNIQKQYYTIYEDITAPSVTSIEFKNNNRINNSKIEEYLYFNNISEQAEIVADDSYKTNNGGIPSCGIKSVTYYLADISGNKIGDDITKLYDNNNNCIVTDVINPDFKGILCAVATDNLGNEKTEVVKSYGIVLEDKATSKISFSAPETTKKDYKGLNLYNNNVDIDITAQDSFSGIKEIRWNVSDINGVSDEGVINCKLDGTINGGTIVSTDKNLITEVSKKINIGNNSNNIIVTVTIINNANNQITNKTAISIDKTRPSIEVAYDNNNFSEEYENEGLYFNADRRATITITERNFDEALVTTLINNKEGEAPSISGFTQIVKDDINPDNNKYVAYIEYNKDGKYSFDISCEDEAGNINNDYVEDSFMIDKTNPTLNLEFDNNNAANTNYYNADRTATVTIVEHNFDPNKVVVNGVMLDHNQVSTQYTNISGWTTTGDTHTATINYSADGQYSLDIDYADKVGNKAADIAQENFYVDKTNPELEISGVGDMSSNKEEVKPLISYSDANFDVNNVSISLKGVLNSNLSLEGSYSDIANGQTFLFNDIPHEEIYDDIYLLDVVVTDKAGNKTTKSISFNVNRFGSYYLLNETVQEMNGKYIQKAQDILLEEQNVDDIDINNIFVKVIKDNVPKDLVNGNDFEVLKSGGNGSIFNYQYKIFKESFQEDGAYYVIVSSVDKAGNTNVNDNESKRAEIKFFIDNTKPVIIPIDLSSGKTYAVDSKDVTISVTDNMKLQNFNIYLDGEEVKYSNEGDSYSFKINSKNTSQSIKLVATDMAGNEIVENIDNIYVTTNYFVRWYTNKTLFIGTILGVLVVVGGVILVIVISTKKKRRSEN